MSIVLILITLLNSSNAFTKCVPSGFKVCTKVVPALEKFENETKLCRVVLEEIDKYPARRFTGWKVKLRQCPGASKVEAVYVYYACNDTDPVLPNPDYMWILSDEECSMHPKKNLDRVSEIVKGIKPGTNLKELETHRIYPKHMGSIFPSSRENAEPEEARYFFHSIPATALTVYVKRIGKGSVFDCARDLSLCAITKIDPPVQFFSLGDECDRAKKLDPKIDCRSH